MCLGMNKYTHDLINEYLQNEWMNTGLSTYMNEWNHKWMWTRKCKYEWMNKYTNLVMHMWINECTGCL